MLLSQYIENLQEFLEENGDMTCVYAIDGEGNDYHKIGFPPSLFYTRDLEQYSLEVYQKENLEEDELKNLKPICVIN